MKLDIVTLPNGRRFAGIHFGSGGFIDSAAIILFTFEAIAVQNLHLIAALHVNTAVAASLALGLGHIGDAKLDVQLEMAVELLFGDDIAAFDLHDSAVEDLPTRRRLAVGLDPL